MKARNVILSLVLIVVVFAFAFMKMQWLEPHTKLTLNRNPSRIEYTKRALCRMDCRHISPNDITQILKRGEINFSKTYLHDTPCPTFAVEGVTARGEHLRVIIAQCARVAKIITYYDMDIDFSCHCPGDAVQGISFFKSNY